MLATLCIIVVLHDDILDRTRNRIAFLTTDGTDTVVYEQHACMLTVDLLVFISACILSHSNKVTDNLLHIH